MNGLLKGATELNCDPFLLITQSHSETIDMESKAILIMPMMELLLGNV